MRAAPWLFELWGRADHQLEPPSTPDNAPWSTWAILGGRGSGKTRAGAEWVRAQVEGAKPDDPGRCRRVALLAETADQARDVMVLGESGLLAVTPPDRRPAFQVSRRRLVWPNGAEAHLFSASDPESLRGPQFDLAWSDELAKWRRAEAAWDMLQFGLRLDDLQGGRPRQIVTTTPRRNPTLLRILEDPSTTATTAPTRANAANLAADFLARVERRYCGATLGRQELDGELILDPPGGLWPRALIDAARAGYETDKAGQGSRPQNDRQNYDRIVVAVDPPITAHQGSDACGIIVAGVRIGESWEDRRAAVLADCSVQGASPNAWAARAASAYRQFQADRLVAEVNQGGDLVETVIRQTDPAIAFRAVRATRGKRVRAEPIAALYEQHRITHASGLDLLEDQMCALTRFESRALATPGQSRRSPDRVDALVWALTDLMLTPAPVTPRVGWL